MQIYSNADLTLIPVPYRQHTLGALTQGFTVTNYSDVAFQVSSNTTGDLGVIPPYFARTFGSKAGDTIQFIPSDLQTAALPQTIMFLNVDESSGGVIPSQTPLAQVPGYALDVQGSVSLSGVGQVAIQGTPTVNLGSGSSVNIANTPSVSVSGAVTVQSAPGQPLNVGGNISVSNPSLAVTNASGGTLNVAGTVNIGNTPAVSISGTPNVAISSGSVNATIQNASLNSQITNAMLSTMPFATLPQKTISISLAAGASTDIYLTGLPIGLYDGFYIRFASSLNLMNSYGFQIKAVALSAQGLWTQAYNPYQNVLMGPMNAIIGFSTLISTTPTPVIFDQIILTVINNSGSAINGDNLTLQVYGKFATQITVPAPEKIYTISNPPLTTSTPWNAIVPTSAGNVLRRLVLDIIDTSGTSPYACYLGFAADGSSQFGNPFISASGMVHFDYTFGNGIPNTGIFAGVQNSLVHFYGFAVLTS